MSPKVTEHERDIVIWMLICNTVKVVSFVCLACVFGQWWISLFSALLLTRSYKKEAVGDDTDGKSSH